MITFQIQIKLQESGNVLFYSKTEDEPDARWAEVFVANLFRDYIRAFATGVAETQGLRAGQLTDCSIPETYHMLKASAPEADVDSLFNQFNSAIRAQLEQNFNPVLESN